LLKVIIATNATDKGKICVHFCFVDTLSNFMSLETPNNPKLEQILVRKTVTTHWLHVTNSGASSFNSSELSRYLLVKTSVIETDQYRATTPTIRRTFVKNDSLEFPSESKLIMVM